MSYIQLTLIGNTAYIFNAEDYMKIRCEHRILGKLIGCSVKWPRNTTLSGLPAIYSPYETKLLVEKGFVQLKRQNFDLAPDEQTKRDYNSVREENFQKFTDIYCDKKIEESKNIINTIIAGKRKKIEKNGGNPDEVTVESILNDIRNKFVFNLDNILIQVPTEEPFNVDSELIETFTTPELSELKYRVFCDLWARGKWITSGEKFGGDFLIYPAEPLYFHASHIVHVLNEYKSSQIPINTFITKGRMSIVVNKFCVFAYEDIGTKELKYQTVQWQGK